MTVAELIKKYNIPKVYTLLFGYAKVKVRNYDYPICVVANDRKYCDFLTEDGTLFYSIGECLIFLDENHTPITEENCEKMFGKKHKEFKPFEKVLILHGGVWCADFYSHYIGGEAACHEAACHEAAFSCASDDEIVSYEGHEDWVGKTYDECHE